MMYSEFIPGMVQTTLEEYTDDKWMSRCPVCQLHRDVSDPNNLPICCGYKFTLEFIGPGIIEPGWMPIKANTLKVGC